MYGLVATARWLANFIEGCNSMGVWSFRSQITRYYPVKHTLACSKIAADEWEDWRAIAFFTFENLRDDYPDGFDSLMSRSPWAIHQSQAFGAPYPNLGRGQLSTSAVKTELVVAYFTRECGHLSLASAAVGEIKSNGLSS